MTSPSSNSTPTTEQHAVLALSPWREAWRVFRSNKAAMLGLVVLVMVMLIMLVGPSL